MPSVSRQVRTQWSRGEINPSSPLSAVKFIGPYIATRITDTFHIANNIQALWRSARRFSSANLSYKIRLALQNERQNQCVSSSRSDERTYHVQDINQRAYESVVALLSIDNINVLPKRLVTRSESSKKCGCRSREECNGVCVVSSDGRGCVPRASNTKGFEGLSPRLHQKVNVQSIDESRRVRRRGYVRSARGDAHTAADIQSGHRRRPSHYAHRNILWRAPGNIVRMPR